jgi:hypothetical protein
MARSPKRSGRRAATARRSHRRALVPSVPPDAAIDVLLAAAPETFQCLQCRALMQRTSVSIHAPLWRGLKEPAEPEMISEHWRCPTGHYQVHLQRPLAAAAPRRRRPGKTGGP